MMSESCGSACHQLVEQAFERGRSRPSASRAHSSSTSASRTPVSSFRISRCPGCGAGPRSAAGRNARRARAAGRRAARVGLVEQQQVEHGRDQRRHQVARAVGHEAVAELEQQPQAPSFSGSAALAADQPAGELDELARPLDPPPHLQEPPGEVAGHVLGFGAAERVQGADALVEQLQHRPGERQPACGWRQRRSMCSAFSIRQASWLIWSRTSVAVRCSWSRLSRRP